jgi:acyl-CoA synthetase (AMP-forming)/AMP-acid ligase II
LAPAKLAVVSSGAEDPPTLSYAQLLRRSLGLAAVLQQEGVRRVAVLLHNSVPVMDVHFAAAAAGCQVVNLNVHLVDRELHYLVQRSRPDVLLADAKLAGLVRRALCSAEAGMQTGTLVLWVGAAVPQAEAAALAEQGIASALYSEAVQQEADGLSNAPSALRLLRRLPTLAPDAAFQVYFTSGTTGVLLSRATRDVCCGH